MLARSAGGLAILGLRPDPKPKHAVRNWTAHSAIVQPGPRQPLLAHLLEVRRRMPWICFEQIERFVRGLYRLQRKQFVADPEIRRGIVIHNFVDRPARWSRRARSANASSFPALTSDSNWRFDISASYSANHSRSEANSLGESSWIRFTICSTLLIPA